MTRITAGYRRANRSPSRQIAQNFVTIASCFVLLLVYGCSDEAGSGANSSVNSGANSGDSNGTSNNGANSTTPTGSSNSATSNNTTSNTDPGTTSPATDVVAASLAETDRLTTHQACIDCHAGDGITNAMVDSAGRNVAPVDLWASSMKANSARDPFFLAVMSVEKARHPSLAGAIEQKCLECHAPLATADADWADTEAAVSDLSQTTTRGLLGADGVSCLACHAMEDEGFGTFEGFSGEFELNEQNEVYGPHAAPFTQPMVNSTGYTPVAANHIMQSEQCATCHTLFTSTITDDSTIVEDSAFPEQTPYLEWRNSTFADGPDTRSCQDCHMPTTDVDGNPIMTEIARRAGGGSYPPVAARSPFGRHIFVGGNTLFPRIFKRYRDELGVTAPDAAFDQTIELTRSQLQNNTASVVVESASASDGTVTFDVRVENLTGHKFPSAYPSRRAWLRVKVVDASGATLLDIGRIDAAGRILDASGQVLATESPRGGVAPHRETIDDLQSVQIYESVLSTGTTDTVHILSAAEYAKDNRLLPAGWSASHPDAPYTMPVGTSSDADFVAGHDVTRYALPVSGTPARVEVELHYQVLGARWAAELMETRTGETVRLQRMIDGVGGLGSELVATAQAEL